MLILYLQLIDNEADKQLFEKIYNEYRKQMCIVAHGVIHDWALAEDAVHAAFIGLINNMDAVHNRSETDTRNYVLKAAKNAALNVLDKESREKTLLPMLEKTVDEPEDNILESLCTRENLRIAIETIRQLPEPYNTVLNYYFVMQMTSKEIASVLQRKPDAVRQQLSRGKKMLYKALKEALHCYV